jgi:hypothetical protein
VVSASAMFDMMKRSNAETQVAMMARRNMTLGCANSKTDYRPWQMEIVASEYIVRPMAQLVSNAVIEN